jgi:hypothetical protein
LSFSVDDDLISSGGSVNLTWSSANTTSCTASGGWSGNRSTSGSIRVDNIQNESTFTLRCEGEGGSVVQMLSVSVLGSLQISWQAPTENVDGTPVDGIATYRIHYGDFSRNYDVIIDVAGNQSNHVLELPVGSYYIAMTAVDIDGEESALSQEIVRQAL